MCVLMFSVHFLSIYLTGSHSRAMQNTTKNQVHMSSKHCSTLLCLPVFLQLCLTIQIQATYSRTWLF